MKTLRAAWAAWDAHLFPEQDILARRLPVPAQVVLVGALTASFTLAGALVPADGFVGFDWVNFFGRGVVPPFYPPWGAWLVARLSWPMLIGLSLAAVTLAVLQRAVHPLSAIVALFALPLFWTLFLGQLEGLVTLGLLGLPWLTPLALLKPQVSLFAFGARRSYLLGLLVFLGASLVIWGPWPMQMLSVNQFYAEGRYATDIALGWWGVPVALPLLWLSRGDADMLMAAGAWMTPHLLPYNLLPIVPALARLPPRAALLASACPWLPFAANWLGPGGWWLGWVFVGYVWLALAAARYPRARLPAWLGALAGHHREAV